MESIFGLNFESISRSILWKILDSESIFRSNMGSIFESMLEPKLWSQFAGSIFESILRSILGQILWKKFGTIFDNFEDKCNG